MKRLSTTGIRIDSNGYYIKFSSGRACRLSAEYVRRINKYRQRVGLELVPQLDQLEPATVNKYVTHRDGLVFLRK